jgi:hypothetical protein
MTLGPALIVLALLEKPLSRPGNLPDTIRTGADVLLYPSSFPYSPAGNWRSCFKRKAMDRYDLRNQYECKD